MYSDQQRKSGETGLLQMRKDIKSHRYGLCAEKNKSKQNID